MAQTPGRACLALEALDKLVVAHELRRDQLERHVALGAEVSGKIDCAHPAFSQQVFQAVLLVEYLADIFFNSGHEKVMLPQPADKHEIRHPLRLHSDRRAPVALISSPRRTI